jgi:hypothetical protein
LEKSYTIEISVVVFSKPRNNEQSLDLELCLLKSYDSPVTVRTLVEFSGIEIADTGSSERLESDIVTDGCDNVFGELHGKIDKPKGDKFPTVECRAQLF